MVITFLVKIALGAVETEHVLTYLRALVSSGNSDLEIEKFECM